MNKLTYICWHKVNHYNIATIFEIFNINTLALREATFSTYLAVPTSRNRVGRLGRRRQVFTLPNAMHTKCALFERD